MSEMQEALKRANLQLNGRPVIEIPAEETKSPAPAPSSKKIFRPHWAIVAAAALALAVIFQLWAEREARIFRDNELVSRIKALETKQDELLATIGKDDQYLDVRVQLDLMELKANYRTLVTQMELMDPQVSAADPSLRDYLKQEIFFLNKRFHDNQREHALLSERISGLEKSTAKS